MDIKARMLAAQNSAVDEEARTWGLKLSAKQVLVYTLFRN
jgi:hypothetical protein